jgi:hypothetical protein
MRRSFAQIATNLDSGARPGNFISYEWIQKNIPEAWKEPSLEELKNSSDSVVCGLFGSCRHSLGKVTFKIRFLN